MGNHKSIYKTYFNELYMQKQYPLSTRPSIQGLKND